MFKNNCLLNLVGHVSELLVPDLGKNAGTVGAELERTGSVSKRTVQLAPLAVIRFVRYAAEAEHLARWRRPARPRDFTIRDRTFGLLRSMSRRNVSRYLKILEGPLEVQRAFEAGRMALMEASRVANMPHREQSWVADRIRADEAPKVVLASALVGETGTPGISLTPEEALQATIREGAHGTMDALTFMALADLKEEQGDQLQADLIRVRMRLVALGAEDPSRPTLKRQEALLFWQTLQPAKTTTLVQAFRALSSSYTDEP
jgi:hypothetical protein